MIRIGRALYPITLPPPVFIGIRRMGQTKHFYIFLFRQRFSPYHSEQNKK